MSSATPRSSSRRPSRQPALENGYPKLPEPRQSHTGNVLAIISVMAVLGFGLWTAFSTLTAPGDQAGAKPPPTVASTRVPTKAPMVAPTALAASPSVTPASATATTTGGTRVHIVGEGDTLYRIAQRYGTTVEAIMAANGFTDRSKILHVGDRLTIP